VDLAKFNGDQLWRLPIPARIALDKGGIVRAAEADPDYTTRPEVDDAVAVLRGIGVTNAIRFTDITGRDGRDGARP
jgi:hypothetical protein